jgi:hypothetical protein
MEQDFVFNNDGSSYRWQHSQEKASDFPLDNFIHGRTRILRTKLEVLASEIRERLVIRVKNLGRIDEDKIHTSEMLVDLDKRAHYLTRQHREKAPFYNQLFKLGQERRLQDVECWQDVVMVTPADFDALGQCKLRFLLPAGVQTANCYSIQVMQGTALVGSY